MIERGASFHQTSDVSTFKIFIGLLQLDRSQLTVVCCNRRCVRTPRLTRRIFTCVHAHALAQFWVRTLSSHPRLMLHVSSGVSV